MFFLVTVAEQPQETRHDPQVLGAKQNFNNSSVQDIQEWHGRADKQRNASMFRYYDTMQTGLV